MSQRSKTSGSRRRAIPVDDDDEHLETAQEAKIQESKPVKNQSTPAKEEVKSDLSRRSSTRSKSDAKTDKTKTDKPKAEPAPKPEKASQPKAEASGDSKKPTEEDLKKKFIETLPVLVKKSLSNSTFLKIWNPKGPLTTGGMAKRLKDNQDKTGDQELVYSVLLAITGSRADFELLFKEPAAQKLMEELEITPEDVRHDFITFSNYEERKNTDAMKELRDVTKKHHTELLTRLGVVKNHFSKMKPEKTLTKQERLIAEFDKLRETNKVYDVSSWSDATKNGFKRIPRPSTSSKKKCMTTYPVCSAERQRMEEFLRYLELDDSLSREAFD